MPPQVLQTTTQTTQTTQQAISNVPLDAWLDNIEAERDALIMQIRSKDNILITFGRLKRETIPRRVR
jgi:hypothetical protein